MDLYLLFALVVIALWIGSFAVYLVLSNRQRDIEGEILQVEHLLHDEHNDDEPA